MKISLLGTVLVSGTLLVLVAGQMENTMIAALGFVFILGAGIGYLIKYMAEH